jgi:hypothetical protein
MRPGSVCRHLKIAGRAIISRFFHVTSQQPESCNTSILNLSDLRLYAQSGEKNAVAYMMWALRLR